VRERELPATMDRITTTIEREWLAGIIAGTKRTEYRQIKPYWRKRFDSVSLPFELRLINGMQRKAPEVTVLIDRIRRNPATRQYELHIARVVRYANWDKRRRLPK
jgi:hypothetical protein